MNIVDGWDLWYDKKKEWLYDKGAAETAYLSCTDKAPSGRGLSAKLTGGECVT